MGDLKESPVPKIINQESRENYASDNEKSIEMLEKEGLKADEIQLYQELYTAIKQEGEAQEITIPMKTAILRMKKN